MDDALSLRSDSQDRSADGVANAIITELTCLDTATTWFAAERFILASSRLMFQQVTVVLKAVRQLTEDTDDGPDTDHSLADADAELGLQFAAPLFCAAVLSAYFLTIVGFVLYSDVLSMAKEDLAVRIIATQNNLKDDTSWTHMWALSIISMLVLIALTTAYVLGLEIHLLV
jgi:hypothetical protein